MSRDTKLAEKQYLSRSGSLAWERVKPFSPPATDTVAESARLIHDFAVALDALDATANHLILDLGTGSCWTSEWLRRLNLRVISVDIAFDMLKVGQSRLPGGPAALVTGDLEALPFRTGSFDRALCLNALHHIPQPAQALGEIARVINDRGRMVLIEPGHGHSERNTSRAAMDEFGVLEQDLEAGALMRLCHDAGFSKVTVRPLSYTTGEIELTLDELSRWRRWTRTKRPLRALRKVGRALLELPGLRKEGLLLEDALSMWTSRVLMRHIGEQAVVVAVKSGHQPAARELRAVIRLDSRRAPRSHRGMFSCGVILRNAGTLTWRSEAGVGRVQLGLQLLDDSNRLVNRDFARVPLPRDVGPGDECIIEVEVPVPTAARPCRLKFDLVAEGVTWFEPAGSTSLTVTVPPDEG